MVEFLPHDWQRATLVGRLQTADGPTPIVVSGGRVIDVSRFSPTISGLLNRWDGQIPTGRVLGSIEAFPVTPSFAGHCESPLLSPFDLQCIKACGVTFAISAIERVIEERARGDAAKAETIRGEDHPLDGGD